MDDRRGTRRGREARHEADHSSVAHEKARHRSAELIATSTGFAQRSRLRKDSWKQLKEAAFVARFVTVPFGRRTASRIATAKVAGALVARLLSRGPAST